MRVILRTYTNGPVAEIMAARLRELDIPVIATKADQPAEYFGDHGPWEVLLEDETILENPVWKQQIEDVLDSDQMGLTPEEEEAIAQMPVVDTVKPDEGT